MLVCIHLHVSYLYLFISLFKFCYRSQSPEERPTASEIVDELLDLERTVPTSSFTEVSLLLTTTVIMTITLNYYCFQSTKDAVGDILDDILTRK